MILLYPMALRTKLPLTFQVSVLGIRVHYHYLGFGGEFLSFKLWNLGTLSNAKFTWA